MSIEKVITPGGRVGDNSSLDRSPKKNWVENAGGLPKYVRMVAHAFLRKGMPMGRAISMAVGVIRNWAEGKGNVTPKVRAAAVATIARWEAMRAGAHVAKLDEEITKLLVDAVFEEITKELACPHNIGVMKSGCPLCDHQRSMDKKKTKKTAVKKDLICKNDPVNCSLCRNGKCTDKKYKDKKVPVLKISKEEFDSLVEEINADDLEADDFYAEGKIEKSDEEKQLVFGWCSIAKTKDGTSVVDKQGDVLEDIDQMEKVAYDFVLHSRDGGEMHVRKGVSTLVESFMSTPEKWAAMGIPEGSLPVGWWVGFKVNDSEVWKAVKSGKYKMFSVHGSGLRKAMEE